MKDFSEKRITGKKKTGITLEMAIQKGRNFCVYQERNQQEVRDKLYGFGLHQESVEQAIAQLITENYINEERFAVAFAGGKFRIKQWGRVKIKLALQQKKTSAWCIKKALDQISNSDYHKMIRKLVTEQEGKTKEKNLLKKNYKIAQSIIAKGFEAELVWEEITSNQG